MKTILPDQALAEKCYAILHRLEAPLSCIEMGRLLHMDSSTAYRAMCAHPKIKATKTDGALTLFESR